APSAPPQDRSDAWLLAPGARRRARGDAAVACGAWRHAVSGAGTAHAGAQAGRVADGAAAATIRRGAPGAAAAAAANRTPATGGNAGGVTGRVEQALGRRRGRGRPPPRAEGRGD